MNIHSSTTFSASQKIFYILVTQTLIVCLLSFLLIDLLRQNHFVLFLLCPWLKNLFLLNIPHSEKILKHNGCQFSKCLYRIDRG